ncbi:MAG: alpha-glucosidase/alpha-galactosidase [Lachnospiraceae bacterium]
MSCKFTFIGAGSLVFTRELIKDILSYPALSDSTLTLMDINDERLEMSYQAVERIINAGNYPAKVVKTKDRVEALKGADGVVCTIQESYDVWKHDLLIPKKYGVDICVGDTRGPSGIFRYLRTIHTILDIAADIEKYCPKAVFLNYTNPMAMICRTVQEVYPNLLTSGLCHSVQGTSEMLADWIGADYKDITYTCAGINHQAFYTEFKWKGEDAYPLIDKAIREREDIYNKEPVRNEMYLALGYYPTESSGHNSEYNAWFRKRPDLIEKYCNGTNWNPGESGFILKRYEVHDNLREKFDKFMTEEVNLKRGHEYAACIFNAILGDGEMFKFNGNMRNFNLVDNLPYGACVEIPVVASKNGIEPMRVGPIPPQLALLSGNSAQIEDMAVQGYLTGNKEMVYQAICFDPLTSAVLSLKEIRDMVDEMFEKNMEWLPTFQK